MSDVDFFKLSKKKDKENDNPNLINDSTAQKRRLQNSVERQLKFNDELFTKDLKGLYEQRKSIPRSRKSVRINLGNFPVDFF